MCRNAHRRIIGWVGSATGDALIIRDVAWVVRVARRLSVMVTLAVQVLGVVEVASIGWLPSGVASGARHVGLLP